MIGSCPAWKFKQGGKDKKKKTVDGKEHLWCPHHDHKIGDFQVNRMWVRHNPEDCKRNPKNKKSGDDKKGSDRKRLKANFADVQDNDDSTSSEE